MKRLQVKKIMITNEGEAPYDIYKLQSAPNNKLLIVGEDHGNRPIHLLQRLYEARYDILVEMRLESRGTRLLFFVCTEWRDGHEAIEEARRNGHGEMPWWHLHIMDVKHGITSGHIMNDLNNFRFVLLTS